jgi:uncharacterized protein involved in exopolysaccharide biosynthesis
MTKDIGLFDLLYVIAKRRAFVIVFTLAFAVGAVIYALVVDKYWISKAVIVPVAESNALSGLDTGLLGMLGSNLLGGSQRDPAVEFVSIMQSRTFREKVIGEFKLLEYFKLTHLPREEAMELAVFKLAHNVARISADEESNLITVRIETKNKLFSRDIAQFYLDELQNYLRHDRGSKSKLQREFLEAQVKSTRAEIDSLAIAVKDFQKRNKAIGLDEQTTALISLYSESISDYYKTEIEYEVARQQYDADSPLLQDLARRMAVLKDKIKDLENSNSKLVPDYVLQIDRIPDLALQYAQLKLNLEIKQKVFEYLYPQYEVARLDEARDMPSFDILDAPSLAGLRSKPKRAVLVSVITFMAFLLACFLAVVKENLLVTNRDQVDRIIGALRGRERNQDQEM